MADYLTELPREPCEPLLDAMSRTAWGIALCVQNDKRVHAYALPVLHTLHRKLALGRLRQRQYTQAMQAVASYACKLYRRERDAHEPYTLVKGELGLVVRFAGQHFRREVADGPCDPLPRRFTAPLAQHERATR